MDNISEESRTIYMDDSLKLSIEKAIKDIKKLVDKPDKELYQNKYREKLKEYGWIIPYKMEIKELYTILNNVKTKKDFTDKLEDFFNVEILENLFNDIIILEKGYQQEITIQIKNAIDSKFYILANNCLMSLIDNNLSFYLKDKRNVRRQFIIEKLINKISVEKKGQYLYTKYELYILLDCIQSLFQKLDFNNLQEQGFNPLNRHLSQHGFAFSNDRSDTILLVNLLYYILEFSKMFKQYENAF